MANATNTTTDPAKDSNNPVLDPAKDTNLPYEMKGPPLDTATMLAGAEQLAVATAMAGLAHRQMGGGVGGTMVAPGAFVGTNILFRTTSAIGDAVSSGYNYFFGPPSAPPPTSNSTLPVVTLWQQQFNDMADSASDRAAAAAKRAGREAGAAAAAAISGATGSLGLPNFAGIGDAIGEGASAATGIAGAAQQAVGYALILGTVYVVYKVVR